MSIDFHTSDPKALEKAFRDAVAVGNGEHGITAWVPIAGTDSFKHVSEQWGDLGRVTPYQFPGMLTFAFDYTTGNTGPEIYGYYHGHLLETFQSHFVTMFAKAVAPSPKPATVSPAASLRNLKDKIDKATKP